MIERRVSFDFEFEQKIIFVVLIMPAGGGAGT